MIALILARGGSKRVPKKNIKVINGKPLLFYPINAAKKSKLIMKVYVSTDDEEIAKVARQYGAEVICRPLELAQDNSTDLDAFKHFCQETGEYKPIVHLRATTPILDTDVIDEAIRIFYKNEAQITSLRSAHETSESVYKYFTKGKLYWESIVKGVDAEKPNQNYPKTYAPNGYVDIVKPKEWKKNNSFHGSCIYPFITKFTPEIDSLDDFDYIEYLMQKKNV